MSVRYGGNSYVGGGGGMIGNGWKIKLRLLTDYTSTRGWKRGEVVVLYIDMGVGVD